MDVAGNYDPVDAGGFIRVCGIRLAAHNTLVRRVMQTNPDRFQKITHPTGPSLTYVELAEQKNAKQ